MLRGYPFQVGFKEIKSNTAMLGPIPNFDTHTWVFKQLIDKKNYVRGLTPVARICQILQILMVKLNRTY